MAKGPYHVISDSLLRSMLDRVHQGEHPTAVYMEAYANSTHEFPAEDDPSSKDP